MRTSRLAVAVALVVAVALLSAASGAASLVTTDQIVRGALVGIGLWALHTARQFYLKLEQLLKQWPNVIDAIWGPATPEGLRKGGLLEISKETERSAKRTETDVRELKTMLINSGVVRDPHDRTRESDHP